MLSESRKLQVDKASVEPHHVSLSGSLMFGRKNRRQKKNTRYKDAIMTGDTKLVAPVLVPGPSAAMIDDADGRSLPKPPS